MKAQRRSGGIALLFLYPRPYMGMDGQHHAPATLLTRNKPGTHRTEDWVTPRAGIEEYGMSCVTGFLSLDRPVRS